MCNVIKKLLILFEKKSEKTEYVNPNYFLDVDDETLDFLEKDAVKCITELNEINLRIKANSFQILNINILGIGSAFILLTQMKEINYLMIGLVSFITAWSACAIYLSIGCLATSSKPLSSTKPDNLYISGYKNVSKDFFKGLQELGYKGYNAVLPILKRMRLSTLSMTIDDLSNLNKKLSFRFNLSIIFAIISPIIAIIISIISFRYL